MKGFNNKFENLPDYILKITHQIWEEKDVNSIMEYYAENIPVRSPMGIIYGPNTVVDATNATLDEFPDRQLLGEDVIWIGNEDEGFLSSHRILSKATHVKDDLEQSINASEIARRKFRDIAVISGLVFSGMPSNRKRNKDLQSGSQLNLLYKQAFFETFEYQLEEERLIKALFKIKKQNIVWKNIEKPSPFSFPIITDRLREKLSSEELGERIKKMQLIYR